MASFYPYLISSLPMLHFEARPPFSFGAFILKCEGLIPDDSHALLKKIQSPDASVRGSIKKWLGFETLLGNELVKLRAGRKKIDPQKYLRPDGFAGPSLFHTALAALRSPSPLESQRILDRERWRYLEDLSFGHYFDLDFLIIYGLKLLILERWGRINSADKAKLLEEALQ